MSAWAPQLSLELADRLEPFRGECPCCGRRVLAVTLDGREVVVEVAEVLERHACPQCAQVRAMGHERHECPRCGLSEWLGEPLPASGVLLDADGRARWFRGGRGDGEAVHRVHVCP